jgi:glyoxylase-like metal-dependent hydrolase (beta-lactamase superfamily II)
MHGWEEVADDVHQRRYEPMDISVCVVRGSDGVLVADTRMSPRQADEILADLRVFDARVRWVVNTHAHYDHTFGNARFGPGSDVGAPIYGHRLLPAHLDRHERPMLADWIARGVDPPDEWRAVVITPPTMLVDDRLSLDLGDRGVDLIHLGRGHTDNDLLVHVPDARAWLAGDLVEESGPPWYGSDSFSLDRPGTVATLSERIDDADVVVPGHGAPVDAAFVAAQQARLAQAADVIRAVHAAGLTSEDAKAEVAERWPFPSDHVALAVAGGYRQLDGCRQARSPGRGGH